MKINNLFVFLMLGLVFLMSCGKPTTPEIILPEDISGGYKIVTKFPTLGNAQNLFVNDDLVYIAQGEGGLMIADIADRATPQIVSVTTEDARGYSTGIIVKDSVVYLAAGSFGVTAIDASDVSEPFVTEFNLPMKPAKSFHIMGDFLISAVSEQGVKFADISYPTYPDTRGSLATEGYAQDITTSVDSTLFVASGELGLSIYHIEDFQNGYVPDYWLVGHCVTPGYAEAISIIEEQSVAFLACGTAGLQIIDYADTTNVHIIAELDAGGYAKNLVYSDQKIFMAAEKGGLQVIDVSNIASPKLIGVIETEFALGIDIDDDYVYIADDDEGLIIISRPD